MAESAYPQLSKAEDIFKSLFFDSAKTAALNALFVAVPWLGVPVVRQTVTFFVDLFSDKLFDAIRLGVDLGAIRLVNAAHQDAFDRASLRLKIIAHDRGIDSPEFRAEREKAKNALAKFVTFCSPAGV